MFKVHSIEKLIGYIQTLSEKEQKLIIEALSSPSKRRTRKSSSKRTEQDILDGIKAGLEEIKEAKRTGKKMKTLDEFLNEL